jgi:hypothetical protein
MRKPRSSPSIPGASQGAREGDGVADIGEAGVVGRRALETEAEALTNLSHTPEDKVDFGHKSRTVRK